NKPNPMPESTKDRCTKAHEYIFLLSRSRSYYCDMDAIREPAADSSLARWSQDIDGQLGSLGPGKSNGVMKAVGGNRSKRDSFQRSDSKREQVIPGQRKGTHRPDRAPSDWDPMMRNKRGVWTVPTQSFKGAHFATFPPDLIRPCIRA
ncbi:DNA methyltransferase, partial [Pseudomonas viridiflava]|uniref:DNA methyltransferase n=1 Tax=Pseudomonas viridiflava TaxID=33069 RepID=UPI0013C337AA